jgi:hypothetical protein
VDNCFEFRQLFKISRLKPGDDGQIYLGKARPARGWARGDHDRD